MKRGPFSPSLPSFAPWRLSPAWLTSLSSPVRCVGRKDLPRSPSLQLPLCTQLKTSVIPLCNHSWKQLCLYTIIATVHQAKRLFIQKHYPMTLSRYLQTLWSLDNICTIQVQVQTILTKKSWVTVSSMVTPSFSFLMPLGTPLAHSNYCSLLRKIKSRYEI